MPTHRALIQPKPNIDLRKRKLDPFESAMQQEGPPPRPRWRDHLPIFLFVGGAVVGLVGGWVWRYLWG